MNSENTNSNEFTASEWLRYTRHIQLPHVGAEGQSKLKRSHALIIGAGGLGSPVGLYLAAAGVGTITLVDHDDVDLSNLQRQILFTQNDIGKNKASRGAKHLSALNSNINIRPIERALTPEIAEALIKEADIVLDCTDNFATRYLINDTCVRLEKPWVFASIHQYSGQCSLFSKDTACFRCLFPEYPQNIEDCNSAGVIGVLPGMLGTLQANEALKYLTGLDTPLKGSLLLYDALKIHMQKIKLGRSPDCICCSNNNQPKQLAKDYTIPSCTSEIDEQEISLTDYLHLKSQAPYTLIDVRSDTEYQAFNLGGTHIPLGSIESRAHEFDLNKHLVCYCQSGARSLKAAKALKSLGYKASSIQGGIVNILKNGISAL